MSRYIIFLALICSIVFLSCGNASATTLNTTPLSNNSNIYVNVSNTEGVSFNDSGNDTYYIQSLSSPNGGFNAVHIADNASTSLNYGGSTNSTNQSGTFYATDTGGRGYQDDVVLLLAVNGNIPNNFAVTITVYGYNWTPSGVLNAPPSLGAISSYGMTLNETFTKSDFLYGLQDWKPTGGNANYPIFVGENMSDPNNMFYLMFIDTHAGLLGLNYPGGNSQFINNGAVQIDYSFQNLQSLAVFNIYAWNANTTQGQGMLWTNSILPGQTGGPSGYIVQGTSTPNAVFTPNVTNGTAPLSVQFTDSSTGAIPLTWSWDFGDPDSGNLDTSILENPSHIYQSPGIYNVTLTVTNAFGISITTEQITVVVLSVTSNVRSGLYNTNLSVNLTSSINTTQIYYTLDGSTPTTNSTLYTGPISIDNQGTTTLNFIGIYGNYTSNLGTEVYTIDTNPPVITINPGGGTYNSLQNVTLTTTDITNTTTYYTTDNSSPLTSKTRLIYSTPIPIYTNTMLEYAAIDAAGNWSPIYSTDYTMISTSPPTISSDLPSGSYTSNQVVDLSAVDELDPNPAIYYTLNGTTPTVNSTLYYWPILIPTGSTVLKFIAVNYVGLISNVVTDDYNVTTPACSGTWNITQLDDNANFNSIAIDSLGYPHIAYYQNSISGSNPELKYAYMDKNGWHIQTIASSPSGSGYYVSLALDSLGYPHLVYENIFGDGNPYSLVYAYENASGWYFTTLTSSYPGNTIGDNIIDCNLVLYQNQPRISFYNETGGQIEYMYLNGSNWVTQTVAANGGPFDSLAINSEGSPCISYYSISPESGDGSLRYAYMASNGTWQVQVVDASAQNVGEYNSLSLDSFGNPEISYIYNDGSLRFAYYNGTQWIIDNGTDNNTINLVSNLESTACKLILNQANNPTIIYQDIISGNLEYAYEEGTGWITANIDAVNGVSDETSLAINSAGVTSVSYESASSNLMYAYLMPFYANASLTGGNYHSAQTVTLTSTSGTTIYYTLNGTAPTTDGILYSGPITIKSTTLLKFVATDLQSNWSQIYSDIYIIIYPVTNLHTGIGYTSIQSAINDIDTLNGDILTINAGNYTENINVDKNLTLKTLGLVNITPYNVNLPVFTIMNSGSGSTIEGFNISSVVDCGVYVDNSTGNTLFNNTIFGNSSSIWGISLVDCNGPNNITANNVSYCIEGINLYSVTGASITYNIATNNIYDGIVLTNSNNNNLSNNNGTTLNVSGIRINNSNNNTINNNNLTGNIWTGISLVTSQYNFITSNIANYNQEGMDLYSSNNNTITETTADNDTYDGIIIANSNNNTIENNNYISNNYSGINIIGTSENNQVINNNINGNLWSDINLYTAGNNIISGNTFNNTEEGIYIYNSNANTVDNNTMNNDLSDGIYIGNNSNNNTITGNTVSNGSEYGIRVQNSAGNTIYSNDFINNYDQVYDNGNDTWDNGTTGNYYNDWNSTNPRPVDGGTNTDNYPSLIPF